VHELAARAVGQQLTGGDLSHGHPAETDQPGEQVTGLGERGCVDCDVHGSEHALAGLHQLLGEAVAGWSWRGQVSRVSVLAPGVG
jgi:hypothetical protein